MVDKFSADREIEELFSINTGAVLGCYAAGHWDKRSFAIACNKEFSFTRDVGDVGFSVCRVRHLWLRAKGDGSDETALLAEPRQGYLPVTIVYL